jgi:hypothetical protein
MTSGNSMQVDPLVALQEAAAREEFFKQRNLFLAQSLRVATEDNRKLSETITGLEADLKLLRTEGASDGDRWHEGEQ